MSWHVESSIYSYCLTEIRLKFIQKKRYATRFCEPAMYRSSTFRMYFFICNFALSSSHASLVKGIDVIGTMITKYTHENLCIIYSFRTQKIVTKWILIKKNENGKENAKRMDENIYWCCDCIESMMNKRTLQSKCKSLILNELVFFFKKLFSSNHFEMFEPNR